MKKSRNHRSSEDHLNYGSGFFLRLLKFVCPSSLYESIEGDLIERFEADVKLAGEKRAKRKLMWNAIRFLRPGIILRNNFSVELNQLYMIRNHFIIAWRKLFRSKMFSFITICGLAVGMTAFLLIVHYVRFERSYENFHTNADHISRITLDIYKGTEFVVADCGVYARTGSLLKEKFPEVVDFARLYAIGKRVVRESDRKFYEGNILFADPSVFKLFSFKTLYGTPTLSDPFQTVITKSIALKYFSRANVTGEVIKIDNRDFIITAVLEDLPGNTHLRFDFLLSHVTLAKVDDYDDNGYNGNNDYTYVLLAPGADVLKFNAKLSDFSIAIKEDIGDDRLVGQTLKDIHLYSDKSYELRQNGNAQTVYFLMIIAVFILFIAWINYINLSTARATERAREVGIRKVMGSQHVQLIFQFLSESVVITLLAGVLCLVLIYTGLPYFIDLTGQALPAFIFSDSEFWYLFISLLLTGSLLAGGYPAFVLSSFKPVTVLKGKFEAASRGQWLRKSLVVFQFASTVVLMICVSTVYLQINHLQRYKLGMNIDQTLVVRSPKIESDSLFVLKADEFKNELSAQSAVQTVTQSETVPGSEGLSATGNVLRPGDEKNDKGYIYFINSFDEQFIPQFEMELLGGRNFEGASGADRQLIINEEAMHALGFKNVNEAVGAPVLVYDEERIIIGVLKNFHQHSPKEKHIPMVFWYTTHANYFSLKINSNHISETVEDVRDTWTRLFPDAPFDYFFLDEKFNQQYKADQQFGKVIDLFSLFAVFIACLGLFGLSSFTIIKRTKEIGIRKVLGASVSQIVQLLSQEFVKLVVLAAVIAVPIGYLAMNEWLSGYATRIEWSMWIFVIPSATILLIALVAVSFQTISAAQTNPVATLKSE